MSELSLTTSRVIKAPAEKVFNAWLKAETLTKFMIPGEGMSPPRVESDGKEGGRFSITMIAGEQEIPHAGTYLTVTPFTKIVFTWESPFSVDGSTVTLDFKPVNDNETELTLTHVKFPNEESRDNHNAGWARILEVLGSVGL